MERCQPETARINLLSKLEKSDFWKNVEIINQELAAYSSEEPGDIPPRNHPNTLALELSACYSNPQHLGETATVTVAHGSPNGELSIEQITGELGLFTYTTSRPKNVLAALTSRPTSAWQHFKSAKQPFLCRQKHCCSLMSKIQHQTKPQTVYSPIS